MTVISRSQYPQDSWCAIENAKEISFKGKLDGPFPTNGEPDRCLYIIDGALQHITITEKVRSAALKPLISDIKLGQRLRKLGLTSFAISAAAFVASPFIGWTLLAGSIATFVGAIFLIRAGKRKISNAERKFPDWNTNYNEMIEFRKKLGKHRYAYFASVPENKHFCTKNEKIFLAREHLAVMWNRANDVANADSIKNKNLSESMLIVNQFVEDFFKNNPLAPENLKMFASQPELYKKA